MAVPVGSMAVPAALTQCTSITTHKYYLTGMGILLKWESYCIGNLTKLGILLEWESY